MLYLYSDIHIAQFPKKNGDPCGDVVKVTRKPKETIIIFCDGLGSGIKANTYANLFASRIKTMLDAGSSLHQTFHLLSSEMDRAWGGDAIFAAFTLASIQTNGKTTILAYEMPPPILTSGQHASLLQTVHSEKGKGAVYEIHYNMEEREGLLLVSDGITQAGMGTSTRFGWDIEGVRNQLNTLLRKEENVADIPYLINNRARILWEKAHGDDCTSVYVKLRKGIIINILSGPPADESDDQRYIEEFIQQAGIKIICGGTTANIASRITKQTLQVEEAQSPFVPPKFKMKPFNLVTEGIITLNHTLNLLDQGINADEVDEENPATELLYFLQTADQINIFTGTSSNDAKSSLNFKQQRILPRERIIQQLAEKLKEAGKQVNISNL